MSNSGRKLDQGPSLDTVLTIKPSSRGNETMGAVLGKETEDDDALKSEETVRPKTEEKNEVSSKDEDLGSQEKSESLPVTTTASKKPLEFKKCSSTRCSRQNSPEPKLSKTRVADINNNVLSSSSLQSQISKLTRNAKETLSHLQLSTTASPSTTSIMSTGAGRSIEIFFGDFTNFDNFYQILSPEEVDRLNHNTSSTTSNCHNQLKRVKSATGIKHKKASKEKLSKSSTVNPLLVKKLCLIGHPLESFRGISNFKRLLEAWVTNCSITELRREDLKGLHHLQRLYAFGCLLEKVDPLELDNLKILWLSGNRLTSLNFLNYGLPSLQELNVANNEISCVSAQSLFKCINLENLNIAGNPLCTIQDIKDANACPKLKELTLVDSMYGKCPVASLCDSRAMIVGSIKNISILNGKKISDEEVQITREYVKHRCLYYYSNSVRTKASYVALRNATVASVYKQLESIGERIIELLTFVAKTDHQLSNIPAFAKNKFAVKEEMVKVTQRIADLRMWAIVTIERFETVIYINRWEQEVEEWIKWIEFQSYGSIQGYIAHSVLDLTVSKDVENIRSTIHQIISGLSCSKPWPEDTVLKVETIAVIRDKGAELGLEKTYNTYFSRTNEPKFIPPPPETPPPEPLPSTPFSLTGQPYHQRCVSTYTDPDYKPPKPLFPFPESVPGLPERSHPCFLFLICDRQTESNPALGLYKLLTDKSENYRDIRFTNCLWNAIETSKNTRPQTASDNSMGSTNENDYNLGSLNSSSPRCPKSNDIEASPFSVVVVMKVLEECLVVVPTPNGRCRKHCFGCLTFGVSKPLSYAPAYIISISHNQNDKKSIWVKGVTDDTSVKAGVESICREAIANQATLSVSGSKSQARNKVHPYYLHKCGRGIKADLTAIFKIIRHGSTGPNNNSQSTFDNTTERELLDNVTKSSLSKLASNVDLLRISKFLGTDIAHTVTTLDLSGNALGLTVGLEGMINLRRLNLSHNNLTTLSGLHKLPHLIELKASWNYLRFLHSCISTLTWATPRLITLEVLPNPFQDVRDYAHIPLLVSQALPSLLRVDIWSAPFAGGPNLSHNCFLSTSGIDIDSKFSHAIMSDSWVQGRTLNYKEFKGQCLTNLDQLPRTPPFPDGYTINAIELDLSDNYLSSTALGMANFVRTSEWRAAVVKLNLQENCITSLDWLKDNIFPNLHILNMSNNHLQELDMIQYACPALIHLHLSGNPLPCSTFILAPLRHLSNLQNLEATRTPLSSHPDYANYVIRYIPKIQILDGTPVSNWQNEEIINHMGGNLNSEWLELNLGQRDWSSLTELSLPHCGLTRVNLPSHAVPKLISLDLTGNQLSTFSGITSLPNLRVLCVSYNSIKSLGPYPCPTCYAHTAESRAQFQKNKNMTTKKSYAPPGIKVESKLSLNSSRSLKDGLAPPLSPPPKGNTKQDVPKVFPRLEVLIMSHNSLAGLSDLHLHCLPRLQTLMLNCNQITTFKGLDKLTSVQAIVLDHNQIKDVPFNTFVGCRSLKYLHLEHNRIACLPRLPHLNNLAALHLGYNRIQSLTDLHCLSTNGIRELTLTGNPAAYRGDYCRQIINQVGSLQKLDGTDVTTLKGDLSTMKFTLSDQSHTKKSKYKSTSSVLQIPHGNVKCRPNDLKYDVADTFMDDTANE